MKKFLAVILALAMMISLFAACGKKEVPADETEDQANTEVKVNIEDEAEPEIEPEEKQEEEPEEDDEPDPVVPTSIVEVTEEEQLSNTGISFTLPEGAEVTRRYIITCSDGSVYPQIDFTFEGKSYNYRIQPSAGFTPYNFSVVDCAWTEETTADIGGKEFEVKVCDELTDTECDSLGYIAWIDIVPGLVHNIYGADLTSEDFIAVADAMFGSHDEIPVGYEQFVGVWKYDAYDAYLRITENLTYAFYGAEGAVMDEIVRFCDVLEDDENTLVLYNEFGGEDIVLTIEHHEDGTYSLADPAGDILNKFDGFAMDGKYRVCISADDFNGDALNLRSVNEAWISDYMVLMLDVGVTLEYSCDADLDIGVETLEKTDETTFVINGSQKLIHNEGAKAWKLEGLDGEMEYIGTAAINENTVFTDNSGSTASFADFIAAADSIYGYITVEKGIAVSIEIEG